MKLADKNAVEKSIGLHLTENIEESTQLRIISEISVIVISQVFKKKTKKFRRLRKFFSMFSCIPNVKN